MSTNIGNSMQEGRNKAIKALVIMASIVIYVAALAYTGVHNWHLLTIGINPDYIPWAAVGVLALELTALCLPIALHYWTFSPLQRIATFAFYALDMLLIVTNVALDFAVYGTGQAIPSWMTSYQLYMLPVGPVFCGIGWSALWLLDPSQKERALVETLRASTKEVLSARIATAAQQVDITQAVDQAADTMARNVVSQVLGLSIPSSNHRQPAPANRYYNAEAASPNEGRPGREVDK